MSMSTSCAEALRVAVSLLGLVLSLAQVLVTIFAIVIPLLKLYLLLHAECIRRSKDASVCFAASSVERADGRKLRALRVIILSFQMPPGPRP